MAQVKLGTGSGSIRHIDQNRVMHVSAKAFGRNSNEVLNAARIRLAELDLPPGCKIGFSGEQDEQQDATSFLGKAFIAGVFLIAMVLLSQFNSVRQALIVMTSVLLFICNSLQET